MKCTNCQGERIATIQSHASDCHIFSVPHLHIEKDGYAPDIDGVCGGDETCVDFCLDCGMIQGFKKISDEELKVMFKEDEE